MKAWLKIVLTLAALTLAEPGRAMTGIDSVAYLWVIGLILMGILGLLVWVIKFLNRVKEDSKKHE